MGLKTIHIAFIVVCVLFSLATTAICVWEFAASHRWSLLLVAVACLGTVGALVPYSFHFMKKLKDIGYM